MFKQRNASDQNGRPVLLLVASVVMTVVPVVGMKLDAMLRRNDRSHMLISASRDGDAHMVRSLLRQGADTGLKDDYGKTALAYAEENNRKDIVSLLLYVPPAPPLPPVPCKGTKGIQECITCCLTKSPGKVTQDCITSCVRRFGPPVAPIYPVLTKGQDL